MALNEIKSGVLNETFSLEELTKLAFDLNYKNHHKALRIAEIIAEEKIITLLNYIPTLI